MSIEFTAEECTDFPVRPLSPVPARAGACVTCGARVLPRGATADTSDIRSRVASDWASAHTPAHSAVATAHGDARAGERRAFSRAGRGTDFGHVAGMPSVRVTAVDGIAHI